MSVIVKLELNSLDASIEKTEFGFLLSWNDNFNNQEELFPDLPLALIRLALLVEIDNNGSGYFNKHEHEFEVSAWQFIDEQTTTEQDEK